MIIKPSSLGDIIHGLLVAASIKRQLPEACIDWVARDIFASFVRRAGCVDTVFTFSRSAGVSGFLKTIGRLRRAGCYDWVLDMQGLARSALMARLVSGRRKVGRPDAREGGRLLIPGVVRRPLREPAHAVERLLPFLEVLGLSSDDRATIEFMPCDPVEFTPRGKYVVLFPESRRAEKVWPYFDRLAQLLVDRTDLTVVWSGTDSAAPLPTGDSMVDLRARLSLECLPELIAGAEWVVANDSGPMHLSAALGRPTIGLFGPTDPRLYGPWPPTAPGNRALRAAGGDLAGLSAEVVADECLKFLASR